ncbi:MAG: ABC transporter permease subunit [Deltaproteobacteria bacterium]|nr:ABC transporter permease subunit [Deltaproteobacteria bacterium]
MKTSGLIIVSTLFVISFLAPYLVPHSPLEINLDRRLEGPNEIYPLGTDHLGRCLLSRLIDGTRRSIGIAVLTQAIALTIGISVGMLSGYWGGRLDFLLMRLVDLTLAFPSLILSLAIISLLGPGIQNAMIAFALVHWAFYARLVRGLVIEVKERKFIEAAVAIGVSPSRMILRHYLPNIFSSILVLASLDTGRVIFALSSLGFLGLGAQPPIPEWGAMLNEGRLLIATAPHLMLFPGLAILITVMGFNLIGEASMWRRKDVSIFHSERMLS